MSNSFDLSTKHFLAVCNITQLLLHTYVLQFHYYVIFINMLFFLAPSMTLGLSLSAPSGTLKQAFNEMKLPRVERCSTLDLPASEQEAGTVPSTDAGLGSNFNNTLAPPETTSSTSTTFSVVSPTSTAPSLPTSSTGRVSPPPISTHPQTPTPVTSDPSPPAQSSHETPPSQLLPAASIPPSSSTISSPFAQTAVRGPQPSSTSVSSVADVTPSSTGTAPASEQQPFNSAVTASQPVSSSVHAAQHTTSLVQPVPISTQSPPPGSVLGQSQVQAHPVELEGAELQTKIAGRDDIQTLDKKLRSLFKDPSSSSSASVDPSQTTGTSSPPTGTSSPPPGVVPVPPSNLALTSGVQGVPGPTTTPGQTVTPAGHAQTPPSKPRAQVRYNAVLKN